MAILDVDDSLVDFIVKYAKARKMKAEVSPGLPMATGANPKPAVALKPVEPPQGRGTHQEALDYLIDNQHTVCFTSSPDGEPKYIIYTDFDDEDNVVGDTLFEAIEKAKKRGITFKEDDYSSLLREAR